MTLRRKLCLLAILLSSLGAPLKLTAGLIVADSVSEFSGTQGQDNWYYGFYDGDAPAPFSTPDFEQMPEFNGTSWFIEDGVFWTSLNATSGHPNGVVTSGGRTPVEHWAVRRWVSEVDGLVTISGIFADLNDEGGDGVDVSVIVDGSVVFTQTIPNGQTADTNYSFTTTSSLGAAVDFAIDPRGSDHADRTKFTAMIEVQDAPVGVVPEPSTFSLLGLGALTLAVVRRRGRRQLVR